MASIPGSMLNMENIIKKVFDHTTDSLRTTSGGAFTVTIDASDDSIAIGDRITGDLMTVNPDGSINTNIMGVTPVLGRIPVDLGAAVVNITGPVTIPGEVEIGNDSGNPIPISALSLPLPIGASTSALQTTGNASLASIDSKLTSPIAVTGPLTNTQLRATPVPVSTTSLPLPTGAATLTEQQAQTNILTTIESYTQVVSGTTYSTIAAAGTNIGAASVDQLVGGVYKQTPPTLTDGDQSEIILNSKGHQLVEVSNLEAAELTLTQDVIDQIKPLETTIAVLPVVTETDGDNTGPGLLSQFIKVGGYDVDNGEYRQAVFNGEALVVTDSTVAAILSPIQTSSANTAASVASINGKTPDLGQQTMANSSPVVIASNQSAVPISSTQLPASIGAQLPTASLATIAADDVVTSFAAASPAINYNFMTGGVTTTGWTDAKGYASIAFSVIGTVANGTFNVEQTANVAATTGANVPFQNMGQTSLATNVGTATVSTTETVYSFPITARYFRIRMIGASTGTVTTSVYLRQKPYLTNNMFLGGGTSSVTVSSGTVNVGSVTSSNLGAPAQITDVAAAAITTTTTTGTITPTYGTTYQVAIPVTVVSGTNPTMDVVIQESSDSGVNWYGVYHFPRITSTGISVSPVIMMTGNRLRYLQTIGGTTPSFTRSLLRAQSSSAVQTAITQLIDRTINLNTLNSVSANLRVHNGRNVQLVLSIGTVIAAPSVQLEGSDDSGLTWYAIGAPLLGVASSTVSLTVSNVNSQLVRAEVSTAGTTVVPNYVLIKGF